MATWEDGPEYAPLERPDAFADPAAATVGLEAPPAAPPTPPAPTERPAFVDPDQPVAPLAALAPEPPAQRDPNVPFDVAASLMTAETSAWASAHLPPPASGPPAPGPQAPGPAPVPSPPTQPSLYSPGPPPTSQAVVNGQRSAGQYTNGGAGGNWPGYGSPTGLPTQPLPTYPPPGYPPPSHPPAPYPTGSAGQPFPPPGPPVADGPFAAPGTPQWFGPGDYRQPAPPPPSPTARTVLAAVTPGVLLTLVVGGFVWVLAPVTILLAFVLSGRIQYGRKVTRTVFGAVLSFLGLVGLLSLITADGSFSQWWDTVAGWACFGSWVIVLAGAIAAYRALKQGRPDPPPAPRAR
ncbi:MAG TPA: hypothetical protein VIT41_14350 [Microlunatus sp.]